MVAASALHPTREGDVDVDIEVDIEVEVDVNLDVDIDRYFSCLKGASKSV